MFLSKFLINTTKEQPKDAVRISHKLMLRSGMIRKLASGIYTWMPIGLITLQNITALIKKEMEKVGAAELLMPSIQPANLWKKSERWEKFGSELLQMSDRNKKEFCYAPTHEEVAVSVFKETIKSYKEFPKIIYQTQTKFRDEIRPRFGVMRSREFLMKDAYSVHLEENSLKKTYDDMYNAYSKILSNLNLKFLATSAETGSIGGSFSHEFNVIINHQKDDGNAKKEIRLQHDQEDNNIEVGHIFGLGDTYTKKLDYSVLDKHGKKVYPLMGCYGIGVSRLVAAIIENNYDEYGIIWPDLIAPFQLAIIFDETCEAQRAIADKIYRELKSMNIKVLMDDRKERVGVKFADIDLIGIPHRIFIGKKSTDGVIEYRNRREKQVQYWGLNEIMQRISNIFEGK